MTPGYNVNPFAIFGPMVDLDAWRSVVPAGQGPITGPAPESPINCMTGSRCAPKKRKK